MEPSPPRSRVPWLARLVLLLGLLTFGGWASTPLGWRAAISLAPGVERHDLEALDPRFRACLEGLLADLVERGFRPVIRATWRDDERQALYHRLGGSQRKTNSLHQGVDKDGAPAARAADVSELWPLFDLSRHAGFYRVMRDLAPEHGLVTGGSWSKTNRWWARYELGWDPAHVEVGAGRCGG